jgi:hypothetical protein
MTPRAKSSFVPKAANSTIRSAPKDGREVAIFRRATACKDCPVAPCAPVTGKAAPFIAAEHAVVATHHRWQKIATRVLYGLRAPAVESVFAQMKQQMGFRHWTLRGLENLHTNGACSPPLGTCLCSCAMTRRYRRSPACRKRPSGLCNPTRTHSAASGLLRIATALAGLSLNPTQTHAHSFSRELIQRGCETARDNLPYFRPAAALVSRADL